MRPRKSAGTAGLGLVLGLCVSLSACMSDRPPATQVVANAQPRHATYNCGEDGPIVVENMRTAVRLTEPEGEVYELTAAPPTQASRYDADGMALVLDGPDALWMKAGSEPVDCRR